MTASKPFGVRSSDVTRKLPAALLTSESTLPKREIACATSFSTSSGSRTSAGRKSTSPPSRATSPISRAPFSSRSSVRPAIVTFAPWAANFFAIARPSPEPPPVTKTDFSARIFGSNMTSPSGVTMNEGSRNGRTRSRSALDPSLGGRHSRGDCAGRSTRLRLRVRGDPAGLSGPDVRPRRAPPDRARPAERTGRAGPDPRDGLRSRLQESSAEGARRRLARRREGQLPRGERVVPTARPNVDRRTGRVRIRQREAGQLRRLEGHAARPLPHDDLEPGARASDDAALLQGRSIPRTRHVRPRLPLRRPAPDHRTREAAEGSSGNFRRRLEGGAGVEPRGCGTAPRREGRWDLSEPLWTKPAC